MSAAKGSNAEVVASLVSRVGSLHPFHGDGMDNKVATDYAALLDRLYLVGLDGKIAYNGDKGPRGFKPEHLREFLDLYLLRLDAVGDEIQPVAEST